MTPSTDDQGGLRYDAGKPRYDLLATGFIVELAKVAEFGAKKYAPRNWEKGLSWGSTFRAAMSHMIKWSLGERIDEESGCSHLAHAAWNMMALWWFQDRGAGTCDMPDVAVMEANAPLPEPVDENGLTKFPTCGHGIAITGNCPECVRLRYGAPNGRYDKKGRRL